MPSTKRLRTYLSGLTVRRSKCKRSLPKWFSEADRSNVHGAVIVRRLRCCAAPKTTKCSKCSDVEAETPHSAIINKESYFRLTRHITACPLLQFLLSKSSAVVPYDAHICGHPSQAEVAHDVRSPVRAVLCRIYSTARSLPRVDNKHR